VHHPGEGQADFGTADFCENSRLHHEAKYLVLSFPYSNGGFLQLNYGENMECLLEGLVAIFEHIGGVPTESWFDNTRTIVTKVIKGGGRNVTERFQRFCEHYRVKLVFMNPESGWEKGNVENQVGYLRLFFASTFWTKLQNIFGHYCKSKLDKVAKNSYGISFFKKHCVVKKK